MFTNKNYFKIILIFIGIFSLIKIFDTFKNEIFLFNPTTISISWDIEEEKKVEEEKEEENYNLKINGNKIFFYNSSNLFLFDKDMIEKVSGISLSKDNYLFNINVKKYLKKESNISKEKITTENFNPKTFISRFSGWDLIINFDSDNESNLYIIVLIKEKFYLAHINNNLELKYLKSLKMINKGKESIIDIKVTNQNNIYILTQEISQDTNGNDFLYHNLYEYNKNAKLLKSVNKIEKKIFSNPSEIIDQIVYIPNSFDFLIISNIYQKTSETILDYKNVLSYSFLLNKIKFKRSFPSDFKYIYIFKAMLNGTVYMSFPMQEYKSKLIKKYYFKVLNSNTGKFIENKIFKVKEELESSIKRFVLIENDQAILWNSKKKLIEINFYY